MTIDRKALEQDGEKLRQMTGEDHGPVFLHECEADFDIPPNQTSGASTNACARATTRQGGPGGRAGVRPGCITISFNSELLLTIKPDGRIEKGPSFTTDDEASIKFWMVMEKNFTSLTAMRGARLALATTAELIKELSDRVAAGSGPDGYGKPPYHGEPPEVQSEFSRQMHEARRQSDDRKEADHSFDKFLDEAMKKGREL